MKGVKILCSTFFKSEQKLSHDTMVFFFTYPHYLPLTYPNFFLLPTPNRRLPTPIGFFYLPQNVDYLPQSGVFSPCSLPQNVDYLPQVDYLPPLPTPIVFFTYPKMSITYPHNEVSLSFQNKVGIIIIRS